MSYRNLLCNSQDTATIDLTVLKSTNNPCLFFSSLKHSFVKELVFLTNTDLPCKTVMFYIFL